MREAGKVRFGETPKPTPETGVLPGSTATFRHDVSSQWSVVSGQWSAVGGIR
jgi:hypothetical protein